MLLQVKRGGKQGTNVKLMNYQHQSLYAKKSFPSWLGSNTTERN